MSRKPSAKTKAARHMGEGEGASYIPYIRVSEFNSLGTTSVIRDWKTGRSVHCLSQGEAMWYYILRWDDNTIDIREQYPLERKETEEIANKLGVKHPGDSTYLMTTDFLVTEATGKYHAYSVKADENLSNRTLEILCIEKLYWMKHNVEFTMLYKTRCNRVLASNIRGVTLYYDSASVFDRYSAIKHLISRKKIIVDLSKDILTTQVMDRVFKTLKELKS